MALTGKYALQGGYARDGYQLCQKHVNAQGRSAWPPGMKHSTLTTPWPRLREQL
jgi:hypothetical protein